MPSFLVCDSTETLTSSPPTWIINWSLCKHTCSACLRVYDKICYTYTERSISPRALSRLWNMAPDRDTEKHSSTPSVRVFNLRWRFCPTPDRVPLEKNPLLNILNASFVREEFKSLIVVAILGGAAVEPRQSWLLSFAFWISITVNH